MDAVIPQTALMGVCRQQQIPQGMYLMMLCRRKKATTQSLFSLEKRKVGGVRIKKFIAPAILIVGMMNACANKNETIKPAKSDSSCDIRSCITPSAIRQEIKLLGPKKEVDRLWAKDSLWKVVLEGVSSGNTDWIELGDVLLTGTDAGSTQTLLLALGEALERNPMFVLKRYGRKGMYISICGTPDIDDAKYGTYEKANEAIRTRIKKVQIISEPGLQVSRDSCLVALKASIKPVQVFFGIDGP
jgi:hypothetical protein